MTEGTHVMHVVPGQRICIEEGEVGRAILKIAEAKIPAPLPFFPPPLFPLLPLPSVSGEKLRLNCALICIIVHINEASLYEYSYFCFVV